MKSGFVIWITGLPSSGKSTIARALITSSEQELNIVHLESDSLRSVLTPNPTYSSTERDWFYEVITFFAVLLSESGVNVLIDATANRRKYRDDARKKLPKFLEVYVKCPLSICMQRDPKGIYRRAKTGETTSVPGFQEMYEEPETAEVLIQSDKVPARAAATEIIGKLKSLGWIPSQ